MRIRLCHGATALAACATLLLTVASPAAGAESLGVPVAAVNGAYTEPAEVNFSDDALKTALYVDSSGAAHVAYVVPDSAHIGSEVALCTIAAGGSTCASNGVLDTIGTQCGEPIQSLKYLPDGNGAAVLAVGFTGLYSAPPDSCPAEPPFDRAAVLPYSETEVFQPGSSTGMGIGLTYDQGGADEGDEIYIPDEDGIDVVGQWSGSTANGTAANVYQFESFSAPASDPAPVDLGVDSWSDVPGWWPAGVTELANGATAVIAYDIGSAGDGEPANPGVSPVGVYVQPPTGGSFAAVRPLGVSGPVETDFAPSGSTYLIDGVSSQPSSGPDGDPPEDLELYDFHGTSLQWLGTIGATDDNLGLYNAFGNEAEWDTMPPSYEDADGDLYVAWYANGTTDACPGVPSGFSSTTVYGCLMYRRVAPGGVFGPKIVLSEDYGFGGDTDLLGDVDQIAANQNGAGWVLVWREPTLASNWTLYAEPLSASATVPAPPTVTGTVTAVPLTCSGSGSCSLSVSLDSAAAVSHAVPARDASRSTVIASERVELAGASHRTVLLHLDRAGRALAGAGRRRLPARLVVVQSLGLTRARSVIYDATLTLR
jgi:hypothetical protein